ncbi:MAG: YqiA/YcfP family alpha/beta fold hydrolase [Leptothrix sp. (in: b-proteobacteria)]
MISHLLYLHGFRSSPQSLKARKMAAWVAAERPDLHWWCPQLPPSPAEAMALLRAGVADWPQASSAVIGSSLGGFYATALAEALGWRSVLLNPAVHPARDLARYIGEQTAWHDPAEHFFFRPEFIAELAELEVKQPTHPEHHYAVIAQGDEVLDWCEMHARYAPCRIKLLSASDHALSDFDDHLADIVRFLDLTTTRSDPG